MSASPIAEERTSRSRRPITSWAQFHRVVKRPDQPLLERLDDYGDSILIAGCQRSGTTALTRLLRQSQDLADFRLGHDDELDGALMLAGYVERFKDERHCFQTTYLNDRFHEYFEHDDFRLIWILREPESVVYSMLHSWKLGALNRLYDACGQHSVRGRRGTGAVRDWLRPSRLEKACASYTAKTEQTFELRRILGDRMLIVDYDELVQHKEAMLPRVYEFLDLEFDPALLGYLHQRSLRKGSRLRRHQAKAVDEVCGPVYRDARALRTIGGADV